jgi:hypothetical protein
MGALKAQEEVKRVQLRDKLEAKRSAKKAALEAQQRAELAAKEEVRTVLCGPFWFIQYEMCYILL